MADSLYAEYLKERTGDKIIECAHGFATYRYVNDNQVYIIDIYVKPHMRKKRIAAEMAEIICEEAREKGCTEVLGTVAPLTNGSTTSLKVLLQWGMRLHSSADNLIILKKDL